jgi:ribosome recycling factor
MEATKVKTDREGVGGRPPIEKSTDELIEAIKGSSGRFTSIAEKLEVSRGTAIRLIEDNPEAKDAYEDEIGAFGERVHKTAEELAVNGEVGMIKYFLNTKRLAPLGWGQASEMKIESKIEHSGKVETTEGGIQVLTDEKLEQIAEILAKKEAE